VLFIGELMKQSERCIEEGLVMEFHSLYLLCWIESLLWFLLHESCSFRLKYMFGI
jgi:hypothetical protein